MLGGAQLGDLFNLLAQLEGALLAVGITLLALVPTLIEMARTRSPGFLSERSARRRVRNSMILLNIATWILGAALVFSVSGLLFPCAILAIVTMVVSAVGLVLLIVTSYIVASTISSIL